MKSIEELQADVQRLYQELEKRRKMELEAAPQTVNFSTISAKAQRYAIEGHPMAACDEHTQQMYLMILLSVAALDDSAYTESFCTIYRIAHGMHFEGDVQELFLSAQQMNFEKLDECTRLFLHDEKRLLLLLECLVIAGAFDAGKKRAMEYIAELFLLMKLTKEEITFLSHFARVILTQDITEYKCEIPNTYGELFECYLKLVESQFEINTWRVPFRSVNSIKIDEEKHEIVVDGYRESSFFALCASHNSNFVPPKITIPYEDGSVVLCISLDVIKQCIHAIKIREEFGDHTIQCPIAIIANSPLAYSRAQKRRDNILSDLRTEVHCDKTIQHLS